MSERKHKQAAVERQDRQIALNVAFALAAAHDYRHNIHLILQAGADIHYNNDMALMTASDQGHSEIVDWLLIMGADTHGDEARSRAAKNGHAKTVQVLTDWAENRMRLKARTNGQSPACSS